MSLNPLEMFLGPPRKNQPVVLLPSVPSIRTGSFGRAAIESLATGTRRLLPAPPLDTDATEQRAWHRDLWLSMSEQERESVALAVGPTALYLAPTLPDGGRTIMLVRDPIAAARASGQPLPKPRRLEQLSGTPAAELSPRMRHLANPQSRALLAPWVDPDELGVSDGPPPDADRWRQVLFGDVLRQVEVIVAEEALEAARKLITLLAVRPKPLMRAARGLATPTGGGIDDARADAVRRLNWLDAELYTNCASSNHHPTDGDA